MQKSPPVLSIRERIAMKVGVFVNERPFPKSAQAAFHRAVGRVWIRECIKNLLHVEGLEALRSLAPEKGVLLAANHRSFFDQYVISTLLLDRKIPWVRRIYFPVRANFFYDSFSGILVNLLIGGGAMYPPIYRDRSHASVNRDSLKVLARVLQTAGNVVGVHPEGTRGKGPDPYTLLPAQPGIGQIAVQSGTTIVPCWINGLSNDIVGQIRSNFRKPEKRGAPVILVFGPPVDISPFLGRKPGPAQYKRVSDHILSEIAKLGAREREWRREITAPGERLKR